MPDKPIKVSIVMVDGSFRERFDSIDFLADQTLPFDEYELIWVEYYDQVKPDLAQRLMHRPNFRSVCLNRTGEYHSSYCFNRGIVEARGAVIAIPDADVIVERDFVETVWRDHQESDRLVEYFHRHNQDEQDRTDPETLVHLRQTCRITNPANHGACVSVRRKWLLEINGYEQHPVFESGFHANDMDVYTRLRNLGLLVKWSNTTPLYHPWHPSTAFVAPQFAPQHQMINERGTALATLPYQGIDPSKDTPAPAWADEAATWLASKRLSFTDRAKQKFMRHMSHLTAAKVDKHPFQEAA